MKKKNKKEKPFTVPSDELYPMPLSGVPVWLLPVFAVAIMLVVILSGRL